ncbi:MAG TPA: SDR family NAD(P)-dependent oxidoreductase [Acidimicrobiales bacterium]
MSDAAGWEPGPAVSALRPGVFEGQTAVVTGGGTGLGREVALAFASLGGQVAIAGRNKERLDLVAGLIRAQGGTCLVVPTNIREVAEVDALRDAAYDAFGHVDHLVNNAGGQFPAAPSSISDNGWRAVVDLNLNGTWNMTNRFMVPMAEAGFGSIVNVVHVYSFDRGASHFAHSGAARAGVVSMVKSLAPALARRGVTINAFAPGTFSTPGMVSSELEKVGKTEASIVAEATDLVGHFRMGTVDEMAAVILFLCSPGGRYVSGATIVADLASMQTNWVYLVPEGTL